MAVVAPTNVYRYGGVVRYEWKDYTANAGGTDTLEFRVGEHSKIMYMDVNGGVDFNANVQAWFQEEKEDQLDQNTMARLDWTRSTAGASSTDKQHNLGLVTNGETIGFSATMTMAGNAFFKCPPGFVQIRVLATAGTRDIITIFVMGTP